MPLTDFSLRFSLPLLAVAFVALALTSPVGSVAQAADPSAAMRSALVPSQRDAALAQERYYASYGTPAVLADSAHRASSDSGTGISWLGFGLALLGTLIAGLAAGRALQPRYTRNRRTTPLTPAAPTPPESGRIV
jgi:hypothetical protein